MKTCPKCGSRDIVKEDATIPFTRALLMYTEFTVYICETCDYSELYKGRGREDRNS